MKQPLLLVIALFFLPYPASALYKCTVDGKTIYQASPCQSSEGQQIIKTSFGWQYEKNFTPNPSVMISDVEIITKPMTNPNFGTIGYTILIGATVTNKSDKEISLYMIYKGIDSQGIGIVTPVILKIDSLDPKAKTTMSGETMYFDADLNKIKKWEIEKFSCQDCDKS